MEAENTLTAVMAEPICFFCPLSFVPHKKCLSASGTDFLDEGIQNNIE
jgi:hypothetical protein